ncbi:unnamed protein product [Rotaria sp. Silwood1]|nr:unnamed protein product [Rotaria sp. Silwood1]CAF1688285.1 unnamed protein product [Rotaria sp. Silwood1]
MLCKIEASGCGIRAVIHQILLKARSTLWPPILSNEFNWLSSYILLTTSNELRTTDNILFMGHLRFIRTLLTYEN